MRPFLEKRREEKRREEKRREEKRREEKTVVPVLVCTTHRLEGDLLGAALDDSGEFAVRAVCLTPRAVLQQVRSCDSDSCLLAVFFDDFGPPEPQLFAGALASESETVSSVVVYREGSTLSGYQAMENSVAGLCSANAGLEDLLRVLRDVTSGQFAFCPITARRLRARSGRGQLATRHRAGSYCRLTPAERDVLRYSASMTVNRTAELLGISPRTVSTHRTRIRGKLGKAGWRELARREGLLPRCETRNVPTIWLENGAPGRNDDHLTVKPWLPIPHTPFSGGHDEPK